MTGGTVAAGGLAVAGHRSAFADETTGSAGTAALHRTLTDPRRGHHRGATWVLGLLVAAAALEPGARGRELVATAKRIAAHPDRTAPRRPSRGSSVSAKDGAAGARGEAWAGFPHARRALDVLAAARTVGAPEENALLDALLTVMSTLQNTELLYTAGPHGLRHVRTAARGVLDAGGTTTAADRRALAALDADLQRRGRSPRGSGSLLTGALFADAVPVRMSRGSHQLGLRVVRRARVVHGCSRSSPRP